MTEFYTYFYGTIIAFRVEALLGISPNTCSRFNILIMISTIETFGQFFLETREDLTRFFLRRLHCPATAADLAQETYLRLHVSEQSVPSQNRRAPAFSIAGNLVVDHVRKERVRANYAPNQNDEVDFLELVPCNDPDSEQRTMMWQDLDRVQTALEELPEDCRTALYLSAVEGLTYARIGERLGISERMVGKRIAQALKHCRVRCDES
ncbi:MAG: RNA polymerase sigma factor [Methylobacter sp.]|nr:RNA polymerase sigma factor [Methylobacter sp.]